MKLKNKKFVILILVVFIVSTIISFGSSLLLSPKISVSKKKITLLVGSEYTEPNVRANMLGKDISNLIIKKGSVDNKKVGIYKVSYSVSKFIFFDKKTLIVSVVDKEAPKIELIGGNEVNVCPNKKYEELGYKAIDNYDGDITNRVQVNQEDGQIVYEVKDSSFNKTIEIRKIEIVDKEKPSITLNGDSYITVYLGNSYDDPGYKAKDNCDGDLSSKVVVEGSVNTNQVGTYNIKYKVKDSSNNEASISRTVKVEQRTLIRPQGGGSGRGIVYLTFDDGPNAGTTNVILDILKEEGVPATFFVTCNGPDNLIKRMYNEGHTVALHTATHNYATVYASDSAYFNDLNQVSNRVERITGQKSMIIRFPGGSSNTISRHYSQGIMTRLTGEVRRRGYHYFDWNVDSNDAAGASSNGVYSNVVNNISLNRENVVLMHDIKTTTRDAIRNIIRYGKNNGFTFKRITSDTAMVTHGVNN